MSPGHGGAGSPGGEASRRLALHHRLRVGGQLRGRDSGQVGAVGGGQGALGVAVLPQLGQHFRIPGRAAAQHEVTRPCLFAPSPSRRLDCTHLDKARAVCSASAAACQLCAESGAIKRRTGPARLQRVASQLPPTLSHSIRILIEKAAARLRTVSGLSHASSSLPFALRHERYLLDTTPLSVSDIGMLPHKLPCRIAHGGENAELADLKMFL